MKLHESFNRTSFSKFLNSPNGRIFRIFAGLAFLLVGFAYRSYTLGIASIVWGIFPLSAGVFDICFISAALGGPLSGKEIRSRYQKSED